MGKGSFGNDHLPKYDWDEIKKHKTRTDRWIVLNGCVYDVTKFQKKHPGGARIIGHFAGEDATVSFY